MLEVVIIKRRDGRTPLAVRAQRVVNGLVHSSGVEGPVNAGLDPGPKGDPGPKAEQDPEDQDPEINSDPEDGVV